MTAEGALVYLVHAAEDAALAEAIAAQLSFYGLGVSGDYSEISELTDVPSDGLLHGASAVVVLCTPGGMRRRGLRRRAAVALVYAQHHPGVVLLPMLLDPRADPTTMFGPYEWLTPASTAPAPVAAAVFDEVFGPSSACTHDQHRPVDDLERPTAASRHEALRIADQALTRARVVRRVLWSAVVAVVVLTGVLAVLMLATNQTGPAPLLVIASPLVVFAAALATLRPTRRDPWREEKGDGDLS